MSTPLQETLLQLSALQQIDSQILRSKKAQATLDNGAQATVAAEAARASAHVKRDALHKVAGDLKDSELKLSGVETKRKSYQQKLYQGSVTNAKELTNIEKEIAALGRQQSDLDGRILELMEAVERSQAESHLSEEQSREAEAKRLSILSAFHSRHEALELELANLTRRRAEAAAQVTDAALLRRYDEIRAKAGGIGIAKIEDGSCGGCHMALPSSLVKAVREGTTVQTCENCRRLLTI